MQKVLLTVASFLIISCSKNIEVTPTSLAGTWELDFIYAVKEMPNDDVPNNITITPLPGSTLSFDADGTFTSDKFDMSASGYRAFGSDQHAGKYTINGEELKLVFNRAGVSIVYYLKIAKLKKGELELFIEAASIAKGHEENKNAISQDENDSYLEVSSDYIRYEATAYFNKQ